jgi:hypothetical protein
MLVLLALDPTLVVHSEILMRRADNRSNPSKPSSPY